MKGDARRGDSVSRESSSRGQGGLPTFRWRKLLTRCAVGWAIAYGIALAVMLAGSGVILWTIFSQSRSQTVMSLGVTLFVLGFAAVAMCLVAWLAGGGHGDQP